MDETEAARVGETSRSCQRGTPRRLRRRRATARKLTTRGTARCRPASEWSADLSVRFERVDANHERTEDGDVDDGLDPRAASRLERKRKSANSVPVYLFENGALLSADAALARGALDWICVSSASVWDACNVPRVSRRGVRERADGDGVVSLAFESEPPDLCNRGGGEGPARPEAFRKHAYRVAELIVHLTRDEAFLRPEPRLGRIGARGVGLRTSADDEPRNGLRRGQGTTKTTGDLFFLPSALVAENFPRDRPGEAERARARLRAPRWTRRSEREAPRCRHVRQRERARGRGRGGHRADAAVATLRRGERAGAPSAARRARWEPSSAPTGKPNTGTPCSPPRLRTRGIRERVRACYVT